MKNQLIPKTSFTIKPQGFHKFVAQIFLLQLLKTETFLFPLYPDLVSWVGSCIVSSDSPSCNPTKLHRPVQILRRYLESFAYQQNVVMGKCIPIEFM